jgi:RNA polymerase sigma factor (sigma-70 family)
MQDEELIAQVRGGEPRAFGSLVERYQGLIFRLCHGVTGNVPDAEELAHDTFVEAYLKLHQLRDPGKFAPWLKVLALNLCRMWYRQRRRDTVALPDEPCAQEVEQTPPHHARMLAGVTRLTASHRLVLLLHYWEGLSYEEAAAFLNVPVGTVMSRLYRARQELKRLVEQEEMDEEEALPDDEFRREVEAEINVLLGAMAEKPEARERLSLLLRRSPERFVALIRQAEGEEVLHDLAVLLRRLGRPAMEVVLSCWQSLDSLLAERALTLLRGALATRRSSRTGVPAARIAHVEAYLLLDALFGAAMPDDRKAELLLDLLTSGTDEQTLLLLANALLCFPEEAFPRLMERFWQTEKPEALHRPPDVLFALCRFGSRFAAELLEPLRSGDPCRQALALEGADAFARSLTGSGLDLDQTPDPRVALEARFRRKWAPPLAAQRDPGILRALADHVAGYLGDDRERAREKALRILGVLGATTYREQIAACARHERPSTRLTALRALAEVGDASTVPLLSDVARSGGDEERAAAAWALGQLRVGEAAPLLLELAADRDREVRGAAVSALGRLGEAAAAAGQDVLASRHERYARRSLRRASLPDRAPAASSPVAAGMADRVREGAQPPFTVALDAAMRAIPALQPYDERQLSTLVGQLCRDFASARRYLVDEGLMTRESSVYRFTPAGESVWRVERYILERYMGSEPG